MGVKLTPSFGQQNAGDATGFQVQANAESEGAQAGQDIQSDDSNEGD